MRFAQRRLGGSGILGWALAQVMQRTAPERRESGTEDHAGIDQIIAGDDAIFGAGRAFFQVGLHQFQPQRVQIVTFSRVLVALGFAFFPGVKAFAGFLAQLAGIDELFHVLGLAAVAIDADRFDHRHAHIQAHGVGQLHRSHRHAEAHRGLVYGLFGDAIAVELNGTGHVWSQHAIDQEAGGGFDRQRVFADLAHKAGAILDQFLAGQLVVVDDLDQRHFRHRVEIMQSDQALWPLQDFRQIRQRQCRGVAGKQGMRLQVGFNLLEQLLFCFQILENGLDDDVGARKALAIDIGAQSRHGRHDFGIGAQFFAE